MPRDIQRLRIVGMLEGVSFLLLLGIAMPLKYAMNWPWAVKLLGPVHGVLFVLYLVLVLVGWRQHGWGFSRVVTFAVASLLPFGPLLVDRQLKTDWR